MEIIKWFWEVQVRAGIDWRGRHKRIFWGVVNVLYIFQAVDIDVYTTV